MKNFRSILKAHAVKVIGAACFRDPISNTRHCGNGLTKEEAEKFAKMNGLVLIKWHAGKKCSQITCG